MLFLLWKEGNGMKLIVRVDDLGFSEAVNYGIHKVLKEGVVTAVGLMINMPVAEKGYQLIQDSSISLGLHVNISNGTPVTSGQLPTLCNREGTFFSSQEINQRATDTVDLEEAITEIDGQVRRFKEITGKKPAYMDGHAVTSPVFFKAISQVAKSHGVFDVQFSQDWQKETGISLAKWFKPDAHGLYNPLTYLIEDQGDILNKACAMVVFHPGFLDQYVLTHSSFTTVRTLEAEALCDPIFKQWIREQQIQLCDFSDWEIRA